MANTITTRWLYPPNWDGNPKPVGGWKRITLSRSCVSDGTDEDAETFLDISELRTVEGNIPTRTAIDKISWNAEGFTQIKLEWDRSPRALIANLAGNKKGYFNYKLIGGIADPSSSGDRTGDILISTSGAAAGSIYEVIIDVKLKDS